MIHNSVVQRLIEQANISIRYQTSELYSSSADNRNLRLALENDEHICSILGTAKNSIADLGFSNVHGATNRQIENSLPMLLDRGLDKTFSTFDDVFSCIIPILRDKTYPDVSRYHVFTDIVLTPFMLAAGYMDEALVSFYKERLALTTSFVIL